MIDKLKAYANKPEVKKELTSFCIGFTISTLIGEVILRTLGFKKSWNRG